MTRKRPISKGPSSTVLSGTTSGGNERYLVRSKDFYGRGIKGPVLRGPLRTSGANSLFTEEDNQTGHKTTFPNDYDVLCYKTLNV